MITPQIFIDEYNTENPPELRYSMRFGHKPRFFPDEMDDVPETIKIFL